MGLGKESGDILNPESKQSEKPRQVSIPPSSIHLLKKEDAA
tara:strand:- start:951 stop:1073 length:123 start_codon:yes stop_codon:yes gene_type:complete